MGTPSGEGRDILIYLLYISEPAPAPSPAKVTATQGTQTDPEPEPESSTLPSELLDWIDWSSCPTNESEILRYQISQQEQSLLSLLDDPGEGPSSRGGNEQQSVYNREGAWNVFVGADGTGDQTGVLVTVDRVLREGEEGALEPELWLSCGESLEEQQDG